MRPKLTIMASLLAFVLLTPLAHAQLFYPAPGAGFDPVNAPDEELARYGFPPRPDASQPVAFKAWARMVSSPQKRLENPKVEVTNIVNGTARNAQVKGTVKENLSSATSDNWSGVAIAAANGTFTANNSAVFMEGTVPAMGIDNCNYGPYDMSWWAGFDGFSNGDVLQAGVNSTNCGVSYSVWYEWFESGCYFSTTSYPCYETNLSLPVTPGDYLLIEVWYTAAAPRGHAYIYNYTTQQAVSVGFNQPPGTAAYQGSSVEWITERPAVGGALANLANYVAQPSDVDYAVSGSTYYYSGIYPAGSTGYSITMTCPSWNPAASCPSTTGISWPYVNLGYFDMWTFGEGPAYQ